MRILLTAMTCEKGEPDANLAAHADVLEAARAARCELAVFPEMSLTGSVDPLRHPEHLAGIDGEIVGSMVDSTRDTGVAAVFGIAERLGDDAFITQACAREGELLGVQRKRHLGEDEKGFSVSGDTASFQLGATRVGLIICAESRVEGTWDACVEAGADLLLMCAAPGLYGRRLDEQAWRDGFEWWDGEGLTNARHHAKRLGLWVAMSTQAGATIDEDFPGAAALVAPTGEIVDRLPDWRPGTLVVDVPT